MITVHVGGVSKFLVYGERDDVELTCRYRIIESLLLWNITRTVGLMPIVRADATWHSVTPIQENSREFNSKFCRHSHRDFLSAHCFYVS